MIITIDGPAGSGKSTVADKLSERLGFIHFNSGSVFRGITAHLLNTNFNIFSITETSTLPKMNLKVETINNFQHIFVNDIDYTSKLRDVEISNCVSSISLNKTVQEIAQNCIKNFCNKNNVVVDGRGVGSTMFPNAEYKFYLDCSVEERARRRFLEDKSKKNSMSLEEIIKLLEERDKLDKERTTAPLIVPNGALIIDSTNLNITQVVDKMYNQIIKTNI